MAGKLNGLQNELSYNMCVAAEVIRRKPGHMRMMRPVELAGLFEDMNGQLKAFLHQLETSDQVDIYGTLSGGPVK